MSAEKYYPYTDPNPLQSDITKTMLNRDFFSVNYENRGTDSWSNLGSAYSYGGYQGWFGNKYGELGDEYVFCNGEVNGDLVWDSGCGLIAASDFLLYLGLSNNAYSIDNSLFVNKVTGVISFDDYVEFVKKMSDTFIIRGSLGVPALGLDNTSLQNGLNKLIKENNISLFASWSGDSLNYDKLDSFEHRTTTTYNSIKEMLNNDIPVIICYSNDIEIKTQMYDFCNKLSDKWDGFAQYYKEEKAKNNLSSLQLYVFDKSDCSFVKTDPQVESHYMNITGMIEFSDSVSELIGKKTMLKIATYGKTYYIDYDEYKNDIDLFTNIMYIYKQK